MGSGLRYETGRDMPPGMQELMADHIARQLSEAAAVAAAVQVPEDAAPSPVPAEPGQTNGERIRAMSDEDKHKACILRWLKAAVKEGCQNVQR